MSQDSRMELRRQIADRLDHSSPERLPCKQVLGIGLTREVCENDTGLHNWLVCRSLEIVEDRDLAVDEAIARAFEEADDQCEFFDLNPPVERQTSFGPLEAQRERQRRLPGAEGTRPERAQTERGAAREERERGQRPLTGTEPEQRALTGEPAPERPPQREGQETDQERESGQFDLGMAGASRRLSDFAERPEDDPDATSIADIWTRPTQFNTPQLSIEWTDDAPILQLGEDALEPIEGTIAEIAGGLLKPVNRIEPDTRLGEVRVRGIQNPSIQGFEILPPYEREDVDPEVIREAEESPGSIRGPDVGEQLGLEDIDTPDGGGQGNR